MKVHLPTADEEKEAVERLNRRHIQKSDAASDGFKLPQCQSADCLYLHLGPTG